MPDINAKLTTSQSIKGRVNTNDEIVVSKFYELPPGTALSLNGLNDVNVVSPASGSFLAYDSSNSQWIDTTAVQIVGSSVNISGNLEVGTITAGLWNGTAIADAYISSAATWNGKQNSLTFGIADTNSLVADGTPVSGEFAQFTADGLVSRTDAEVRSDIGLGSLATLNSLAFSDLTSRPNYVADVAGTTDQIEVVHTAGEGSTPTISLAPVMRGLTAIFSNYLIGGSARFQQTYNALNNPTILNSYPNYKIVGFSSSSDDLTTTGITIPLPNTQYTDSSSSIDVLPEGTKWTIQNDSLLPMTLSNVNNYDVFIHDMYGLSRTTGDIIVGRGEVVELMVTADNASFELTRINQSHDSGILFPSRLVSYDLSTYVSRKFVLISPDGDTVANDAISIEIPDIYHEVFGSNQRKNDRVVTKGATWVFCNTSLRPATLSNPSAFTVKILEGDSLSATTGDITLAVGAAAELICTDDTNGSPEFIIFGSGIS